MTSKPIDELRTLAQRVDKYATAEDLTEMSRQAALLAERARQAMDRAATATDPTGMVTATVRANGDVESVYVSPYAISAMSVDALGVACVQAVTAGRRAVAAELTQWLTTIGSEPQGWA